MSLIPLTSLTTPFAGYRRLPEISGRGYLPLTLLARLPATMLPLGVLTMVTATTNSIAPGGVVAASTAVGQAVGPPLVGALCDRFGQRAVLLTLVPFHVLALLSLLMVRSGPEHLLVVAAVATGATLPPVSPLSRARWMRLAPGEVRTALAFEGTVDEFTFITGPVLVGVLTLPWGPTAPVLVAAVLNAVFVTAFALHRTATGRSPARKTPTGGTSRLAAAAVPFAGMIAMGVIFGASQTSVTAAAGEVGRAGVAPIVYAVMAVGSTVTTLSLVLVPSRIGLWVRWSAIAVGLTVGGVLMALADGLLELTLATAVLGLFVGPALVTVNSVAAERIDLARGGAVMTLLGSGVVIGVAVGAALAGMLAERGGSGAGFAVVIGAALTLLALVASRLVLSRLAAAGRVRRELVGA